MKQKKCVHSKKVMKRSTYIVPVVLVLLIIPGCASFSKADCLHGDWYEIGLRDGKVGEPSERFNYYKDICSKFDVIPDIAKYSEGRTKGLEFFCTRTMGYSEGREGREYRGVCAGSLEKLFLEGHSLGYRVHSTEEVLDSLDRELRPLIARIAFLESRIDDLRSADPQSESAADLSNELSDLGQDLNDTEDRIETLQIRKNEAIIEYREAIEEALKNGFLEASDLANEIYFRDENADP